jgi:hypothetical protein
LGVVSWKEGGKIGDGGPETALFARLAYSGLTVSHGIQEKTLVNDLSTTKHLAFLIGLIVAFLTTN